MVVDKPNIVVDELRGTATANPILNVLIGRIDQLLVQRPCTFLVSEVGTNDDSVTVLTCYSQRAGFTGRNKSLRTPPGLWGNSKGVISLN